MRFYDPKTISKLDSKELYPRMKEDDGARKCLRDGLVPSVSTILGIIHHDHLEKWKKKKALEQMKAGRSMEECLAYEDDTGSRFGSLAHAIVEKRLKGSEIPEEYTKEEINVAYRQVAPMLEWIDRNVRDVKFCEKEFVSEQLGYAGTGDWLITLNNDRLVLGDLKAKKNHFRFPMRPSREYWYQLSAYRKYFEEKYGPMLIANFLISSPYGQDTTPVLEITHYKDDGFAYFEAARMLWLDNFLPQGRSSIISENKKMSYA